MPRGSGLVTACHLFRRSRVTPATEIATVTSDRGQPSEQRSLATADADPGAAVEEQLQRSHLCPPCHPPPHADDARRAGFQAEPVDQLPDAFVARPRDPQSVSFLAETAIRLRDRHRPIVQPGKRLQERLRNPRSERQHVGKSGDKQRTAESQLRVEITRNKLLRARGRPGAPRAGGVAVRSLWSPRTAFPSRRRSASAALRAARRRRPSRATCPACRGTRARPRR